MARPREHGRILHTAILENGHRLLANLYGSPQVLGIIEGISERNHRGARSVNIGLSLRGMSHGQPLV